MVPCCSSSTQGQHPGVPDERLPLESLGLDCAKVHVGNTEPVALTAPDLPSSRQLLLPRCDRVSGELGQPNGGISLSECCLFRHRHNEGSVSMDLQPLGDRLIVEALEEEETT